MKKVIPIASVPDISPELQQFIQSVALIEGGKEWRDEKLIHDKILDLLCDSNLLFIYQPTMVIPCEAVLLKRHKHETRYSIVIPDFFIDGFAFEVKVTNVIRSGSGGDRSDDDYSQDDKRQLAEYLAIPYIRGVCCGLWSSLTGECLKVEFIKPPQMKMLITNKSAISVGV